MIQEKIQHRRLSLAAAATIASIKLPNEDGITTVGKKQSLFATFSKLIVCRAILASAGVVDRHAA
jgi:hypothetical protein